MGAITQRLRRLRLDLHFKMNPEDGLLYDLGNGDRAYLWPDEISYKLFTTHKFESSNRALWEAVVGPDMTVFDVGANWGIYALAASRLVGSSGHVYAFEPNPRERDKLNRNLDLNGVSGRANVTVSDAAVGNYEGETSFHIPLDYKGAYGSIKKPDIAEDCEEVTVPLTTIDSFCAAHGINGMDALKMDVEGNELNVLKGATDCLGRFQPVVFMEVSDRRTKVYEYKARELCDILIGHGYDLFVPGDVGADGTPVAVAYTPTDYISYVDVVALPPRFGRDWLTARGVRIATS